MALSTVESPGKNCTTDVWKNKCPSPMPRALHTSAPTAFWILEKDDYSNFPSLAYARGFLLIYARLLGVDVSEAAARLENSNPVDIEEYEYLSGKPAPLTRSLRRSGGRSRPSIVVHRLHFLAGALIVRHVSHQLSQTASTTSGSSPRRTSSRSTRRPRSHAGFANAAPPATSATPESPAGDSDCAGPDRAACRRSDADKEVTLRPLKKAWVKIQKESDDSAPVYEDWLYPDAGGLTLHGRKFWIQLSDGSAVEIRKNGQCALQQPRHRHNRSKIAYGRLSNSPRISKTQMPPRSV